MNNFLNNAEHKIILCRILEIVYAENSEQFSWENSEQFYLMQKIVLLSEQFYIQLVGTQFVAQAQKSWDMSLMNPIQ